MMDYSKFRQLVKDGEKPTVDFKIDCDAFNSKLKAPNAELAKDICAMANNGNVSSYIIVGVSDDGRSFLSVKNTKLTDDNLQSFCKTAIFPPPKIKVLPTKWIKGTSLNHNGKEFVIIQIGPQRHQVFRLAKDFIEYKEKLCYRRNEVWIRRGSTSDLATPEEIAKIVEGVSLTQIERDPKIQEERLDFSRLSQHEKEFQIKEAAIASLSRDMKYSISRPVTEFTESLVWKKLKKTLVLIYILPCETSMPQKYLIEVSYRTYSKLAYKNEIPLSSRILKNITAIKRIILLSVLESVPESRIAKVFPSWKKAGPFSHYYRTMLRRPYHSKDEKKTLLSSSSELLVIDKIKSESEFTEILKKAIIEAESIDETVIKLNSKNIL
jgi:hypothetical protein